MPAALVQVALQGNTLLPRDRYVNTFHFENNSPPDAAGWTAIFGNLQTFYNTDTAGAGTSIATWIGPTVSRTASIHSMKGYWLPDAKPRVPRATLNWTLAAPGNVLQDLPSEVAICISYYSSVNQPRRRGRIYIGPLIDDTMTGGAAPRVAATTRTHFGAAAARLVTDAAADSFPWVVHSEAAQFDFPITDGWVDNEFDTQRRRGLRADARTLWT